MGTVHGVYLKYVALSGMSYAGYAWLSGPENAVGHRMMGEGSESAFQILPRLFLGYSTLLNGTIAALFKMEWGMGMIGKNGKTGRIPLWSYVLFAPFHM
jgi:hypothetical protein